MKIISLWQPWATLVVIGAKQFETRGFDTSYRGELGIHATKTIKPEHLELCYKEPFSKFIPKPHELPLGAIIGRVELIETYPTDELVRSLYDESLLPRILGLELAKQEYFFGNYTPNRFGWHLKNAVPFPKPIPASGSQGFWNFDVEKFL